MFHNILKLKNTTNQIKSANLLMKLNIENKRKSVLVSMHVRPRFNTYELL